jgi:membrane protein DedA with SNARE-associated domain
MVARARLFFRRYGFAAVLLSRFLGPMRAVVPLVAGVMEMNSQRFQAANVIAAVIWVPAISAPGYSQRHGSKRKRR